MKIERWNESSPPPIERLRDQARQEGYRFLDRLVESWEIGLVRFEHPGEAYFLLIEGDETVGCGGVATDPYTLEDGVGRIRALYVSPDHRGRGYGRALLEAVERFTDFHRLRLRTDDAAGFYERAGYSPCQESRCTHAKRVNLSASKEP